MGDCFRKSCVWMFMNDKWEWVVSVIHSHDWYFPIYSCSVLISWSFLGHFLVISWSFLGHFLVISWSFFWSFLGHVLAISWSFLGYFSLNLAHVHIAILFALVCSCLCTLNTFCSSSCTVNIICFLCTLNIIHSHRISFDFICT